MSGRRILGKETSCSPNKMDCMDTKRKAEKRVEWRMLSLQWNTCPWAEQYDWLIEWLIDWLIDLWLTDWLIIFSYYFVSVAVVWSVESLPSNPARRVQFPAGSGILIYIMGFGVCPLSCVLSCAVSGGGPDIVLTTHSGRPALLYLSSVLSRDYCSPYRHLSHGHLDCKSLGV